MIQRIQTLYMLLAGIAALVFAGGMGIWQTTAGTFKAIDNPVYVVLAGLSAGLFFANIFNFKKRKLQVVLNRGGILLSLILSSFMIYEYITVLRSGEATGPAMGLAIPLLVIILAVMANKAIAKDEALVKSADRFR
jgi:hypothetical protein